MFLINLTSKLVLLVAILQINTIFAGPISKWERLETDSKEAIHYGSLALDQYTSQLYAGSNQMIITNISSVEINPETKEFSVEARFEESDCLKGNYSATCKILKNGIYSSCHFRGVDNNEGSNFGTLNCQGNAAPLPMPKSKLFLKPTPVLDFFPKDENLANPLFDNNIEGNFWGGFVALYCVIQVSEVFASDDSEEEWVSLNDKSPDVITAAEDGILEYEILNNVTHKFVIENIISAMYHWEGSTVEYIIVAKFKETDCPRDLDVEASSCAILEDEDSKFCLIYKKQPYHASGYIKALCD
ncbi:hypothetical protein KQX54_004518 [Cotesia glomerata]|uniref:Uncharacterized protein n=1 Tax=Cotesia glomerata TaxID=32391 RepID=A0AAV7IVX8_COTGL|nr:hypothetical protein KQX54_004518 [Cotesia glomerata]